MDLIGVPLDLATTNPGESHKKQIDILYIDTLIYFSFFSGNIQYSQFSNVIQFKQEENCTNKINSIQSKYYHTNTIPYACNYKPLESSVSSSNLHQNRFQHDNNCSNNTPSKLNTIKRKRSWSRAVFSNLQRKGLEIQFQQQKYITKPDRRKLAARLNLTDAQVNYLVYNQ